MQCGRPRHTVRENLAVHRNKLLPLCLWLRCLAARVILGIPRSQSPPSRAEDPELSQPKSLQCKLQCGAQHAHSVFHAAAKINRGSIFKILGWARYFSNAKSEMHALRQHLVVKYKVVGIFQQRQAGEYLAAEGSISAVIFRQLDPQEEVFEGSQEAIGNVFPDW